MGKGLTICVSGLVSLLENVLNCLSKHSVRKSNFYLSNILSTYSCWVMQHLRILKQEFFHQSRIQLAKNSFIVPASEFFHQFNVFLTTNCSANPALI